jgi:hypothetical protein
MEAEFYPGSSFFILCGGKKNFCVNYFTDKQALASYANLMLGKNYLLEENITKRKRPYNRAVEKRLFFEEFIESYSTRRTSKTR